MANNTEFGLAGFFQSEGIAIVPGMAFGPNMMDFVRISFSGSEETIGNGLISTPRRGNQLHVHLLRAGLMRVHWCMRLIPMSCPSFLSQVHAGVVRPWKPN